MSLEQEPALAQNPVVSRESMTATLRKLWPYLWPTDRPDLQRSVAFSLVLVLIAKIVTVAVPFTFKWATDALVASTGGHQPTTDVSPWLIGAPVLAAVLYGAARVLMSGLVQLREGLFAKVAMHAVRKLAIETFEHMHTLSLRFHLERKTGGLTRVLERGRTGIEELSRMDGDDAPAHDRRVRAGALRVRRRVRLALRRGHGGDDRGLSLVHDHRHGLAHDHPPDDERQRQRGEHQGGRQPAQL